VLNLVVDNGQSRSATNEAPGELSAESCDASIDQTVDPPQSAAANNLKNPGTARRRPVMPPFPSAAKAPTSLIASKGILAFDGRL
jgi:hypothetical protein